jgi:hypothetical protein
LRLPRDEALQVLDGRLHRTRPQVQLGQREHSLGEIGGNRGGLFQLGFGLLDVSGLELSHRELVMRRGVDEARA